MTHTSWRYRRRRTAAQEREFRDAQRRRSNCWTSAPSTPEVLEDAAIEQRAFEAFAFLHPHEAHAQDPDLFWTFFHEHCPEHSRDDMLRMLNETSQNAELTNGVVGKDL